MVAMAANDEQVIVQVPVKAVAVDPGRRSLNEAGVEELMRSIEVIGLRQPIEVTEDYHLITGLHRLTAFQRLGHDKIPAVVSHLDHLHRELVEIDENLVRSELTVLERSRALARKKEIYEALHPETRKGSAQTMARIRNTQRGRGSVPKADSAFGSEDTMIPSFIRDTALKTNRPETLIREEVRIGRVITKETEDVIKGTPVENRKNDLKGLSEIKDPTEQLQAATVLVDRVADRTSGRRKVKNHATGRQIESVVPREVISQVRRLDRVFERLEETDPKTAAKYHPANDREYAAARMHRMVKWMNAFIAASRLGS